MVGKGDVVEVEVGVLRLERAPAAVQFAASDDCMPMIHSRARSIAWAHAGIAVAMQQHADHGGVVHIRIVRVGVLERPAAGAQSSPAH